MDIDREKILKALGVAYELGVDCSDAVNSGPKGFTENMGKKERTALNKLLKSLGLERLTDEEYTTLVGA